MIRPLGKAVLVAAAVLSVHTAAPRRVAAQADGARDRLLVPAGWLQQHLGDPNVVLLHVGDSADYANEHIPGAVYTDVRAELAAPRGSDGEGLILELPDPGTLQARLRAKGISDDSKILLYWGSEWVTPTARALFTLQWAGLGDRAMLLDGGLEAWKAAGGAVTADVPTPTPGDVTVRPQPSLVVDADWVEANARATGYRVIDARRPEFYRGERADRGKSGHIPGAVSVPWPDLIDEQLHLKDAAVLRQKFEAAGVQPGDTVVTYCHIGQYASAVLFAARTLGYPVKLYDGSFQDWAMRNLPVEVP